MPYADVERTTLFFVACVPIRYAIASVFLLAPLYRAYVALRVLGGYAFFTAANFVYYAVLTARGEESVAPERNGHRSSPSTGGSGAPDVSTPPSSAASAPASAQKVVYL